MYENELYHHGVLGMHWGIRRYQPYGEGYSPKKKGKNIGEASKADKIKKDRTDAVKRRKTMSDKELARRVKRLENECKLKDLTEKSVSPGKAAAKEILVKAGKKAAATVLSGVAVYAVYKVLQKNGIDIKDAAKGVNEAAKNIGKVAAEQATTKLAESAKSATEKVAQTTKSAATPSSGIKLEFGSGPNSNSNGNREALIKRMQKLTKEQASRVASGNDKDGFAKSQIKKNADIISKLQRSSNQTDKDWLTKTISNLDDVDKDLLSKNEELLRKLSGK